MLYEYQRRVDRLCRRRAMACAALALLALAGGALAQAPPEDESPRERRGERDQDDDGFAGFSSDRLFVPRWRLTDGPQVHAAFRDVVADARQATVCVHCDGDHQGIGGVVGPDGWILTKATPLRGKIACLWEDGRELPATLVGENPAYDLALLKVDAAGLPALDLTSDAPPAVGSWVASVGKSRDPVAVGVVSVPPREIPAQSGVLGVQLDENNQPVIVRVFPDSAAEAAGVKEGDRVLSVGGVKAATRDEVIDLVRSHNPGDEVALSIARGDETITLRATLSGQFPGMPIGRSEFQNSLGGKLSVRRFGFPLALQHDTPLRAVDCGGPVVDLDGRVVGFNIARAGRTECYAIPVKEVRSVISELMTAGLAATTTLGPGEDAARQDAAAASESDAVDGANEPEANQPDDEGAASQRRAAASEPVPAEAAASAYEDEGYHLAWSDEFNVDGAPDAEKWTYERGFVRNEELQWYQPENASCSGGLLVIEGRKERVKNPRYDASGRRWQRNREFADYTSSSLLTRGIASWQYGRFEMRGRIDVRPGLWPAFWTLGDEGGWPACGEIDVMEYYRGMVLANAAWAGSRFRARWDDSRTSLEELGGEAWAKKFHTWRMDWDENRIALFVDGQLLNEVNLSQTINETRDRNNPFRQPHYMILNLALGGTNGGDVEKTEFPARFEIDYVRVYQK